MATTKPKPYTVTLADLIPSRGTPTVSLSGIYVRGTFSETLSDTAARAYLDGMPSAYRNPASALYAPGTAEALADVARADAAEREAEATEAQARKTAEDVFERSEVRREAYALATSRAVPLAKAAVKRALLAAVAVVFVDAPAEVFEARKAAYRLSWAEAHTEAQRAAAALRDALTLRNLAARMTHLDRRDAAEARGEAYRTPAQAVMFVDGTGNAIHRAAEEVRTGWSVPTPADLRSLAEEARP